jgi:hypothetical protein
MASPPPGQVILVAASRDLRLHALLGPDPQPPATGGGGFEHVERPRRRPLTVWTGPAGMTLDLTLLLEHEILAGRGFVRDKLRVLEKMAGVDALDPEPPPLQLYANLPHHDNSRVAHNRWVISAPPEYGRAIYNDRGGLTQLEVGLVLLERTLAFVERLPRSDPFAPQTIRKGESLRMFAKRVLGDAKRWKDILSLNRDDPRCPRSATYKLKKAHKLKVPPRQRSGR